MMNVEARGVDVSSLMARPNVAWPTIGLFVSSVVGALLASSAALLGYWSVAWGMLINTVCSYVAYSIVHEAAHGLITTNRRCNDWIGRISLAMVTLTPFFRTYRFLHMTHHRFTNDPNKDPDISCGGGRWWTLPLRWATMDVAYIATYLRHENYTARPSVERREFWLATAFGVGVVTTVVANGWWLMFLMLYVLPTRISIFVLAIVFDYLPHYPQDYTAAQNERLATNNRVGFEWLLTPLTIGHNYHLSHHLYPSVPFYRYRKVWAAKRSLHEGTLHGRVVSYRLAPERLRLAAPVRSSPARPSVSS